MAGEDPVTPLVDPCAEAQRLRQILDEIVTGGRPVRIKENDREVQYGAADITRLERMISDAEDRCSASLGHTPPRRRFAKRLRFSRGPF